MKELKTLGKLKARINKYTVKNKVSQYYQVKTLVPCFRDCIEKNVSIFYDKNNFVPSIISDKNQHKLVSLDFSDLNLSIKEITKQLKDYNENNIYNVSKFNLDDEIKKDLVRLNF